MKIPAKTVVTTAILAFATLVPAAAFASTPSDHQQGPVVHDRTPHVHTHTMKPHRS